MLPRTQAGAVIATLFFLGAAAAAKASVPDLHDFPLAIYYPVRAMLDGGNPYDRVSYLNHYPISQPFAPYAPGTLLLHLPFGLLSLAASSWFYTAFMAALTVVLAFLALKYNGLETRAPTVLLIAGVILLSRPGRMNFVAGNVTLQMVIAAYVALHYADRRPWLSGLGLAVALLKVNFGGPLLIVLMAMGHLRAVSYGAGFAGILNLPAAMILAHHSGGFAPLSAGLFKEVGAFQTGMAYNSPLLSPSRVDGVSLVSRLLGEPLGFPGQLLVAAVVFATAIWAIRAVSWKGHHRPTSLIVGIAGGTIVLSGYHQPYDLLILTLPAVAAVYGCLPAALSRPAVRGSLLALYALLAVNYLTSFRVLYRLGLTIEVSKLEYAVVTREPWVVALLALNAIAVLALQIIHLAGARITGADSGRGSS